MLRHWTYHGRTVAKNIHATTFVQTLALWNARLKQRNWQLNLILAIRLLSMDTRFGILMKHQDCWRKISSKARRMVEVRKKFMTLHLVEMPITNFHLRFSGNTFIGKQWNRLNQLPGCIDETRKDTKITKNRQKRSRKLLAMTTNYRSWCIDIRTK